MEEKKPGDSESPVELQAFKEELSELGSIIVSSGCSQLSDTPSHEVVITNRVEIAKKILSSELKVANMELRSLKRRLVEDKDVVEDRFKDDSKQLKMDLSAKEENVQKLEKDITDIADDKTEAELLILERDSLLRTTLYLRDLLEQSDKKVANLESAFTKSQSVLEESKVSHSENGQLPIRSTSPVVDKLKTELNELQSKHDLLENALKSAHSEKVDLSKRFTEKCNELDRMANRVRKLEANCKGNSAEISNDDCFNNREHNNLHIGAASSALSENATFSNGNRTDKAEDGCYDETALGANLEKSQPKIMVNDTLVYFRGAFSGLKQEVTTNVDSVKELFDANAKIQDYINELVGSRQILAEKYNNFCHRQIQILEQFTKAVKTLDNINDEMKNENADEIERLHNKIAAYEKELSEKSRSDIPAEKMKVMVEENDYFRQQCISKQVEAARLNAKVVNLEDQIATMKSDWDDDKQELMEVKAELATMREQMQQQASGSSSASFETFNKFMSIWQQQNPSKQ